MSCGPYFSNCRWVSRDSAPQAPWLSSVTSAWPGWHWWARTQVAQASYWGAIPGFRGGLTLASPPWPDSVLCYPLASQRRAQIPGSLLGDRFPTKVETSSLPLISEPTISWPPAEPLMSSPHKASSHSTPAHYGVSYHYVQLWIWARKCF